MHPLVEKFLEHPLVYRTWQSPFAMAKMEPVFQNNDLNQVRRVLDVGCGPGTNTAHFHHTDYLGVDINPDYIEKARKKHGKQFLVADVTKMMPDPDNSFDFVLANSFFHHISDEEALRILNAIAGLMLPTGAFHVLDLTLPAETSVARFLALRDRGQYPRPLASLRNLVSEVFDIEVEHPYPLQLAGLVCWRMVYFKGRKKPQAGS